MVAYQGDYVPLGSSPGLAAATDLCRSLYDALIACGMTPTVTFDPSQVVLNKGTGTSPFAVLKFADGVTPEIYVRLMGVYLTTNVVYRIKVWVSGASDFVVYSEMVLSVVIAVNNNNWFEASFTDSSLVIASQTTTPASTRAIAVVERAGSSSGSPRAGNFITFNVYGEITGNGGTVSYVHRQVGNLMVVSSAYNDGLTSVSYIPGAPSLDSLSYCSTVHWANGTHMETLNGAIAVRRSVIRPSQQFSVDLGGTARTYRTQPYETGVYSYSYDSVSNVAFRFD